MPTKAFDHMLGESAGMKSVFAAIDKLAPTDLTILILGETGTGKELAARSLHRRSKRGGGPFVALNCAALPSTLIESELFGFEKGSFTGAVAPRTGHIESADGGTLFLDEIAELPWGTQAKLLRVLQDHRVQRVGASHDRKIDVRFLAATHQDLPMLVESRAFRKDLFHRLNEVQLELPPLRQRDDDVRILAEAVLERAAHELGRQLSFTDEALSAMIDYEWPGNVRELENSIRRAATTCPSEKIAAEDLQLSGSAGTLNLADILERAKENAVRSAMRRHRGDQTRVTEELQISMAELQELLRTFGIRT